MRRRDFLALVGGATLTWPNAARSQQAGSTTVIGVLTGARENDALIQTRLAAFRNALQELGWTEARNVQFEVRWGRGEPDRLRAMATDLVKLAPNVILAMPR